MSAPSWDEFKKALSGQAAELGIPLSCSFELTARCNLSCRMCYVNRSVRDRFARQHEKTADQWLALAQQAKDAGLLYVLLTGGEVFLRRDFRTIYEGLKTMGLIPSIYTNGTLITTKNSKWLRSIPPETIEVSIYGASAETYKAVCGKSFWYKKAVSGIDALLEAGMPVALRTTVIPENEKDYDPLMKFAQSRNVTLGFCSYIAPRRGQTALTNPPPRLSAKNLVSYMRASSEDNQAKRPEAAKQAPETEREGTTAHAGDTWPYKCNVGRNSAWISWNGEMSPCALVNDPVSHPFHDGFPTAWRDLHKKAAQIPPCTECASCSLAGNCLTCPPRLKAETGSYRKSSPYLCELAKNIIKPMAEQKHTG